MITLGDITLSDLKAEGFKSLAAFIDAWLDIFGYWDPNQIINQISIRRIA